MVLVVDLISCGFVVGAAGLRAAVSVCLPVCFWWWGFVFRFWFAVYCVCCVRFEFVLWLLCSLG